MGFEFKGKKKLLTICGKEYEYKTSLTTQQARENIVKEIKEVSEMEHTFESIQRVIKSMADFIEDTLGKGSVDAIFGDSGSKNTDFTDLYELTMYIIEETAKLEEKAFSKYKIVPDKERK
jgi:hypothetical protein